MKQTIFSGSLLFVSIIVILSLCLLSADNTDQQYAELEQQIRQLNQVNSKLDSSVLGLRLGRELNYDRLSGFERELALANQKSFQVLSNNESNQLLNVDVSDLAQQVERKIQFVNDFKSDHAIVKNALAGFFRNLQNLSGRQLDPLMRQRLNELEVDGHRFNLLGTVSSKLDFQSNIDNLIAESKSRFNDDEIDFEFDQIGRHANKFAALRLNLDLTIDRLIQVPVGSATDAVMRAAQAQYEQVIDVQNRYRNYLFISISILFAYCIYQFFTLIMKSRQIRDSNEKLEQRVEDRTQQLINACSRLEQLNEENEKLAVVAKYTDNAVIISDAQGRIEWVNDGFVHCTGYSLAEAIGKTPGKLLQGELTDPKTVQHMREQLLKKQGFNVEVQNYTKHGKPYWVAIEVRPIHDKHGEVTKYIAIESDVTERIQGEKERERLSTELQSAARHAGMAEVATGVLHNVGNVLNSVNVSSNLMMDKLKTSSMSTLTKATEVIVSKKDELGEFLTEDNRGKNFPNLLEQVTRTLEEENALHLTELQDLMKNVSHIKEIVSMQQNFATRGGAVETIDPVELMDDALRIIEASFVRHEVAVQKNYSAVSAIQAKKHEVLQILINLIKNAKQSVTKLDGVEKKVELRITADDRFVRFEVADNGIGISDEAAKNIFQHGFTTKKSGHGFGLHSCAISAQEMGGCLSFTSEGANKGATFHLSLPVELDKASV